VVDGLARERADAEARGRRVQRDVVRRAVEVGRPREQPEGLAPAVAAVVVRARRGGTAGGGGAREQDPAGEEGEADFVEVRVVQRCGEAWRRVGEGAEEGRLGAQSGRGQGEGLVGLADYEEGRCARDGAAAGASVLAGQMGGPRTRLSVDWWSDSLAAGRFGIRSGLARHASKWEVQM
jgi:hypothetical protein